MFCTKCGAENFDEDNFCAKCGCKLRVADEETTNQSFDSVQNSVSDKQNVQYVVMPRREVNFGLFALVDSLILRFACGKDVTKYGWREYTANIMPDKMKPIGFVVIAVMAFLAILLMCLANGNKEKNKYAVATVIIGIITTFLSCVLINTTF